MANDDDIDEPSDLENSMMESLNAMEPGPRNQEIENLLRRLKFEERLAGLTTEEYEHMCNESLNAGQQKKLDAATGSRRDELAEGYARTMVMIQCAWADYLNGVESKKPFDSSLRRIG